MARGGTKKIPKEYFPARDPRAVADYVFVISTAATRRPARRVVRRDTRTSGFRGIKSHQAVTRFAISTHDDYDVPRTTARRAACHVIPERREEPAERRAIRLGPAPGDRSEIKTRLYLIPPDAARVNSAVPEIQIGARRVSVCTRNTAHSCFVTSPSRLRVVIHRAVCLVVRHPNS